MLKSVIISFYLVAIVCGIPQDPHQRQLNMFIQLKDLSATGFSSKIIKPIPNISTSGGCAAEIDRLGHNMGSWDWDNDICYVMDTTDKGGPWNRASLVYNDEPHQWVTSGWITSSLSAYTKEEPIFWEDRNPVEMRNRCNTITTAMKPITNGAKQYYFCVNFNPGNSIILIRTRGEEF